MVKQFFATELHPMLRVAPANYRGEEPGYHLAIDIPIRKENAVEFDLHILSHSEMPHEIAMRLAENYQFNIDPNLGPAEIARHSETAFVALYSRKVRSNEDDPSFDADARELTQAAAALMEMLGERLVDFNALCEMLRI